MTGTSARWRALRAAAVAVLGFNVVGVLVYTTAVGAWPLAQQKDMLGGLFLATVYGFVGVVIVLRRPSVPMGWLLLACGALWSGGVWTIWAQHVVDTGGHLHGLAAVAADD